MKNIGRLPVTNADSGLAWHFFLSKFPLQVPCILNAYKDVDATEGRLAAQIQDDYLRRSSPCIYVSLELRHET